MNYNRLNESLKFVEDIIRFSIEDKKLLKEIRGIRVRFLEVKKHMPVASIITTRASQRDPGRSAAFDRAVRRSTNDLVAANMTRAKESARILEEILRTRVSRTSGIMKDIRYRLYDLEQALYAVFSRTFDPRLYAIFDETFIKPSRLEHDIKIMVRSGITMVQLRIKNRSDRDFYHYAKRIMKFLNQSKVIFIINNRIDIAIACNAHGVHLGQQDISVRAAREMLGDHRIIGASVHTRTQAHRAQREGADYLGAGAVFPTATKKESRVIGLKGLRSICNSVDIPVVGIGGIHRKNYRSVLHTGAAGIAVSSYLFQGSLRQNIRSLTGEHQ